MRTHIGLAARWFALWLATAAAACAPTTRTVPEQLGRVDHEHGAVSDQATRRPPEQLGRVSFANSCAPAAQATFERAVALLHSFWFREGEKTFREVLERDPDCAIATWGIATILIGNTATTSWRRH